MIYTYESRLGNRVERDFPMDAYPQSIKVDGVRMELVITGGTGFAIEHVEHLSQAFPGKKRVIRNRHDIRNLEAANPGVRFNPEAFQPDADFRHPGPG